MIPPNMICIPDGIALAFTNPEATNVPDYPLLFADIENSCLGGHYDWCQDRCAQDIQPFENAAFPYVQLQSDVPPNIGGGVTATLGTITYDGKHYLTVWTPNLHPQWTLGQDDNNPSGATPDASMICSSSWRAVQARTVESRWVTRSSSAARSSLVPTTQSLLTGKGRRSSFSSEWLS